MTDKNNKDRQKEFLDSVAEGKSEHSTNTQWSAKKQNIYNFKPYMIGSEPKNKNSKGLLIFVSGLVIITVLFGTLFSSTPPTTNGTVFAIASPSAVVVINTVNSSHFGLQGSGIVIAPHLVVTSKRVGGLAGILSVKYDGKKYQAYRSDDKSKYDLCLLYVPGLLAPPVTLASKSTIHEGQQVFAISAPDGKKTTISRGIISELRFTEDTPWIVNSAPIYSGSCGGGLFDKKGKLIGITIATVKNSDNTNLAIAADIIQLSLFAKLSD